MAKVDAKTYAKNVLKSAGYITAETIKGVNPGLTSFITDTGGAAKDMFQQAKDFRRNARRKLDDLGLDSKTRKNLKNDVLSDFKTGKFYNPEREAKAFDSYMAKEGFSFDLDELEQDLKDDSTPSVNAASSEAVMSAADRIAGSQQQFMGISTDNIVRNARGNAQASMAHNERMFGMVNNSLAVVNSSIMALHQDLAQPLNTHIINSMNFYQSATTELAKQTKYLENINSILTNRYGDGKPQGSSFGKKQAGASAWEEIMGGGLPNVKKLGAFAKNRLMSSSGLDMLSGFIDPDTIKMMMDSGALSSPIGFLATQILTSKLQGGATGRSLDRFSRTLKGGFAHAAGRLSAYGSKRKVNVFGKEVNMGGIFGKLAELLDIAPKANNKINFGNYNKGRADWTGMDAKALREVIPTQLARIISILSGEEAKVFDYNTGRWVSAAKVVQGFKKSRREAIDKATSSFSNDITKQFIEEGNAANPNAPKLTSNSRATMNFKQDFDALMNLMAMSGLNPSTLTEQQLRAEAKKRGWVGKSIPGGRQYLIDEHNFSRIMKMLFRRGASNRMNFSSSVYDARVANNRHMANAGDGTFGQVINGSGLYIAKQSGLAGTVLGVVDDKGNNIFDYLQDYYKMLRAIDKHIMEGRGGSVRRDRRSTNAQTDYTRDWGAADIPVNQVAINRQNSWNAPAPGDSWNTRGFGSYTSSSGRERWNSKTNQFEAVDQNATGDQKRAQNKFERKQEEKSSPISRGLDKLTDNIGNFLLGPKEARGNINLLDTIKEIPNKINEGIHKLLDKVKGFFSNMWSKFKESTTGKNFFQAGKDMLLSAGRGIVNRGKSLAGSAIEAFTGDRPDWAGTVGPAGAYRGGQVRKSGMISVSEGEYIVPAERNPYYNKHVNKFAQRANESKNYKAWVKAGGSSRDFWGSYAEGGEAHDPAIDGLTDDQKKSIDKAKKRGLSPEKIAESCHIDVDVVKGYIRTKNVKNALKKFKNNTSGVIKSGISKISNSGIGQKVGASIDKALTTLFGSKEGYKNAKDTGKEALSTLKKNLPKSMAGGALGAILGGALTGSGLGLLGGFVLGAGSIVINNSDKISKTLFGDPDEKGNYSNGKLPPKVANFIKKKMPNAAKTGGLGAALGLLGIAPGGILGGFALGAGVDLLLSNEKVKDALADSLLGKKGVNGKRTGGVVGAFKINIIDPLANFVQNAVSKAGDYIKENFINPVIKIFDPIKDWVKGKAKRIGEKIANGISDTVHRSAAQITSSILGGRVVGAIKSTAGWALGTAAKIGTIPGKIVTGAANKLERHNVRVGYSSKDVKERIKLLTGEPYYDPKTKMYRDGSPRTLLDNPVADTMRGMGIAFKESVIDPIAAWSKDIGEQIKTSASALFEHIKFKLKDLGKSIKTWFGKTWLGQKIQKAKDTAKLGIRTGLLEFKDRLGNSWDAAKNAVSTSKFANTMRGFREKGRRVNNLDIMRYNRELSNLQDQDPETANEFIRNMNFYANGRSANMKAIKSSRQEMMDRITNSFDMTSESYNEDVKNIKKLFNSKAVRDGDWKSVNEYLKSAKSLDDGSRDAMAKYVSEASSKVEKNRSNLFNFERNQKEFFAAHPELGLVDENGKINQRRLAKYRTQSGIDLDKLIANETVKLDDEQKKLIESRDQKKLLDAQKKENPLLASVSSDVSDIKSTMIAIASKDGVDTNSLASATDSSISKSDIQTAAKAVETGAAKGLGINPSESEPKEGDKRQNTSTGLQEEFRGGKWVPDESDSDTKQKMDEDKKDREVKNKFFSGFLNGGLLSSLKGLFTGKDGQGEKKETLLDKIKNGLSSLLGSPIAKIAAAGGILAFLSSTGIGEKIMNFVLEKIPTIVETILTAIPKIGKGILQGIKNWWNSAEDDAHDADSETSNYNPENKAADQAKKEETEANYNNNKGHLFGNLKNAKNTIDTYENQMLGRDMTTYDEDDYVSSNTSTRVLKRVGLNTLGTIGGVKSLSAASNFLMKHGGILGKATSAIFNPAGTVSIAAKAAAAKAGAAATKIGGAASKIATSGVGKVIAEKGSQLGTSLNTAKELVSTTKFGKVASKVGDKITSLIKSLGSSIQGILKTVAQKFGVNIPTDAGEGIASTLLKGLKEKSTKLVSALKKVATFLYWFNLASAITYGFQSAGAKEILGILDEPTFLQRVLAAACNGINAAIPLIGGIIETSTLVTVVYNVIKTLIPSADFGDFEEQRAAAEKEIADYNAANNTNYNIKEYLYNVLGEATIQTRVEHGVSQAWDATKKGVTAAAKWTANAATTAWNATKSGVAAAAKWSANAVTTAWNATKTGVAAAAKWTANAATTAWNATKTGVTNAANWVGDKASNLWNGAKNIVSGLTNKEYLKDAWDALSKMKDKMNQTLTSGGDNVIKNTLAIKAETDKDNPLSGVVSTIGNVSKLIIFPQMMIKHVVKSIYNKGIKPVIDAGKKWTVSGLNSLSTAKDYMISGDISGLLNMNSNTDEKGFWGVLSNVQDTIAKVAFTVPTAVVWVGSKIKDGFNFIKDSCKKIIGSYQESKSTAKDIVQTGSLSELWSMNSSEDTGVFGFISDMQDLSNKMAFTLPTAIVGIGNKIKEGFIAIKEKVISIATAVSDSGQAAGEYRDAGDLKGLWNMDSNTDPENPYGFISNVADTGYKLAYTVPTVFNAFGNKISEVFSSAKDSFPDIKSLITDLWGYTDTSKDMSGYDSMVSSYKSDGSGIFGSLGNAVTTIIGTIMKPIVNIARIGGTVGEVVGDAVEGVKDAASNVKDTAVNTWNTTKSGVSTAADWVGDTASTAWNGATSAVSGAANDVINFITGKGSGLHVSQRGNLRRFGNSTISQNGCGPAVATTVLRAYGRNADINSAARYAEAGGYVAGSSGVGTRASYFSDILGSSGIKTGYTSSQGAIRRAVGSGNPTILLGQDSSNRSKTNSPFGPNPHYVVARGSDMKGHVLIDDPELNGTAIYNKSILNNAKLGVMTGGASGVSHIDEIKANGKTATSSSSLTGHRADMYANGQTTTSASDNSDRHKVIWDFLKSNGFNNNAAAGIMGCWESESHNNPTTVEGYYLPSYPGDATVLASPSSISSYTTDVLFPAYDKSGSSINKEGYNANGYYYPGIGLAQWTGPRCKALMDDADKNGRDWRSLSGQLNYFISSKDSEYNSKSREKLRGKLSNATSVDTATADFLDFYEMGNSTDFHKSKRGAPLYSDRLKNAIEFYNKYSGSTITTDLSAYKDTDLSSSGTSATQSRYNATSGSSSSSSSSITDLGSLLSSAFSGAFKAIASKLGGVAGKILELITGGFGSSSSSSSTSEENNNAIGSTDQSFSGTGETNAITGDSANGFPLYLQADSQWGSTAYGNHGTIASAGCGPSSMAMVLKSYGLNKTTNPVETAQWSANHGFRLENGTSWDFFKKIGSERGLDVEQYGPGGASTTDQASIDKTRGYLANGIPVIGSMRPGHFTTGGHFIVFSGMDDNGNIYVNDPSSKDRSSHAWLPSESLSQAKEFWAVKRPDGTGSLSKHLKKTEPSTVGSRGGSSGIPLYDFTRMNTTKYYGGASQSDAVVDQVGATDYKAAKAALAASDEQSKKLDQILLYLKQMAANTAYNASIPTIVELIGQCISVMGKMNGAKASANTQDAKTNIDNEINSMMSKLEAISKTL